jgi:hypothetical protein
MRDYGKITYLFLSNSLYNQTIKIPHLCEKKKWILMWFGREECGVPYLSPKDNFIQVFMDTMKKTIVCPRCKKTYIINIEVKEG